MNNHLFAVLAPGWYLFCLTRKIFLVGVMSKRKAGAQEQVCPLDALAKHAEHCRVVTATSAFKPTSKLCSQPHRLDSFKPCVPVGAFPAVRDVAASIEHRAKFSLPSAIGSFQRVIPRGPLLAQAL